MGMREDPRKKFLNYGYISLIRGARISDSCNRWIVEMIRPGVPYRYIGLLLSSINSLCVGDKGMKGAIASAHATRLYCRLYCIQGGLVPPSTSAAPGR